MPIQTKSFFSALLCLFVLVLCIGCSEDPAPGRVTGVLKLNGNPVPGAMICFYPEQGGSSSIGLSDEKGKYELLFSESRKGAEVGRHKVTISTARPSTPSADVDPNDPSGTVKVQPAVQESVPRKYVDRETTDLIKEVKKGKQVIDIEINT